MIEMEDVMIEEIIPAPLPFSLYDKIFCYTDEEGNEIGEKYSYNDWILKFHNMSGISEELLGRSDD